MDRQRRTSSGAQEVVEGRVEVEMSRDEAADHLNQSELLSVLSNKHRSGAPPCMYFQVSSVRTAAALPERSEQRPDDLYRDLLASRSLPALVQQHCMRPFRAELW